MDALPGSRDSDPLPDAIRQITRPHASKVLALCSSPASPPDRTRNMPADAPPPATYRHLAELDYIGPSHTSAAGWNDFSIVSYLVHTAITIPPRSNSRSDPWVVITSKDGITTVPRGYRVPLLFLAKVQWESLKLLLTSARSLWDIIKYDLLHLARLCTQFLAKARNVAHMKRQWRDPMFDRPLTRFFNGWLGCRDLFMLDFYNEFKEEEYKDDMLSRRWAQKVVKGIQGFVLTEQELVDGFTSAQLMAGLNVNGESGTFTWSVEPGPEHAPDSDPPISPARRRRDEAVTATINSRGSSPLTSDTGSDVEMIAESSSKATEPPTPTGKSSKNGEVVQIAYRSVPISQPTDAPPPKKSHKAKPRPPKPDRLEQANRPLRTRTMSGGVSASAPGTPKIATQLSSSASMHLASSSASSSSTPNASHSFDFTAPVESRGRKRKIESVYSVTPSPLTSDGESGDDDEDYSFSTPRDPKDQSRVAESKQTSRPPPPVDSVPDGRGFSTNARIVIPRLQNPEVYSKPTTQAYAKPTTITTTTTTTQAYIPSVSTSPVASGSGSNFASVAKGSSSVRKPTESTSARKLTTESPSSPRKAIPPIIPLHHYKLYAISSSPSTHPYDIMNPTTPIPPRNMWRHDGELDYISPHDYTAYKWTDMAILGYMVDNAFTIPSRNVDSKQTWVEVTATSRKGVVTRTVVPRGYRIPLLWLGKVQWDCMKLLLTSGREYWDNLKWDVFHIARLSAEFLRTARGQLKMKRQFRDPMFDRAMSRFFNGWMGSRVEFVWDFYREFRDEEYEDDMLQRRWLQKAVKGIQGFAITERELNDGITAEQVMRGLVVDFEKGTFDWIDADDPAPVPAPAPAAVPAPSTTVTSAPVATSTAAPSPAPSVATPPVQVAPQPVQIVLNPVQADEDRMQVEEPGVHSPLSLSQVAGVHSRSPSPLTPVYAHDTSMDVDPPELVAAAARPSASRQEEEEEEEEEEEQGEPTKQEEEDREEGENQDRERERSRVLKEALERREREQEQEVPAPARPLATQETENVQLMPTPTAAVQSEQVVPMPVEPAQPQPPPTAASQTEIGAVSAAEVIPPSNNGVVAELPVVEAPSAHASPAQDWAPSSHASTPPFAELNDHGSGDDHTKDPLQTDDDTFEQEMDVDHPAPPTDPEDDDAAVRKATIEAYRERERTRKFLASLGRYNHTASDEDDELDADFLAYPPSPSTSSNAIAAMDDPPALASYAPDAAAGFLDTVNPGVSLSEDDVEFDEADYIRSRLPSPFVMTPTVEPTTPKPATPKPLLESSHELPPEPSAEASAEPSAASPDEPPVRPERTPTPPLPIRTASPVPTESSESIRSSSSPEPRFPQPEEFRGSLPPDPTTEAPPSPPPDSDMDEDGPNETQPPAAAMVQTAPAINGGPAVEHSVTTAPPIIVVKVPTPAQTAHILPLSPSPADSADEFPPGFQFIQSMPLATPHHQHVSQPDIARTPPFSPRPSQDPPLVEPPPILRASPSPAPRNVADVQSSSDKAADLCAPSTNGRAPSPPDDDRAPGLSSPLLHADLRAPSTNSQAPSPPDDDRAPGLSSHSLSFVEQSRPASVHPPSTSADVQTLLSALPNTESPAESRRIKLEIMTVSLSNASGGASANDAIELESETDMDIETPVDEDMEGPPSPQATPTTTRPRDLPSLPLDSSHSLFTPETTPRSTVGLTSRAQAANGVHGPSAAQAPPPSSTVPAPAATPSHVAQNNDYMVAPGLSTIASRTPSRASMEDFSIFGPPSPPSRPPLLPEVSPPTTNGPRAVTQRPLSPLRSMDDVIFEKAPEQPVPHVLPVNGVKASQPAVNGATEARAAAAASQNMDVDMDGTGADFHSPIRILEERIAGVGNPVQRAPIVLGPSSSFSIPSTPSAGTAASTSPFPSWVPVSRHKGPDALAVPASTRRSRSPVPTVKHVPPQTRPRTPSPEPSPEAEVTSLSSVDPPVDARPGPPLSQTAPEPPQLLHMRMRDLGITRRSRSPLFSINAKPAEAVPRRLSPVPASPASTSSLDPNVVGSSALQVYRAPEIDMRSLENSLVVRLKDELRGELMADMREELGQLKSELLVQMKEDLLVQLKDDLFVQLKQDLLTELKEELLVELKSNLLAQLKDELLVGLQAELLVALKDELKGQLTDELTMTLKNSLREHLRADLKDDMIVELKDHFSTQLKDHLKVLLVQLKDAVNSQLRDDLVIQLKYFIAKLKAELISQLKDTLTVHLKDGLITQVKTALTAQLRDGLGAQREQLNLDFERRRLFLDQHPRSKSAKPGSPATPSTTTPSRPPLPTSRPSSSFFFQARHPLHHLVLSTGADTNSGMDVDASTPPPPPTPPIILSPSKSNTGNGSDTPLPVKSQRKQSWFASGYQAS